MFNKRGCFLVKLGLTTGLVLASASAVADTESICGTNDRLFVNETPRTPFNFPAHVVISTKGAVGALQRGPNPTASKFCSGTLIDSDLFLTAGHCVDRNNGHNVFVSFNYEREKGSNTPLLEQDIYEVEEVVEFRNDSKFDYAVLRLEGNPASVWGKARLASYSPTKDSFITIIQHPKGEPKQVDAGSVLKLSGNRALYSSVDTLPGSSGSGVFDFEGSIVAVHTNGGCRANGEGSNKGYLISEIRKVSQTIEDLID